MVRRTRKETEATREAILDAAVRVFVKKGVARASLEQIAQEAGVTRGAVYWHFKNKPDLFKALHDQLYEPFAEMILADLEHDHPEPLNQLENLCTGLFQELDENTAKQRLLTLFFLKCDYSGDMNQVLEGQNERKERSIELFSRYFERAQDRGLLPGSANPRVMAMGLLCFITGLCYEYLRNPALFDLKQHALLFFNYFFKGLSAD